MRIALTGTPGVGKTTLARLLAEQGWRVVDVKAWARAEGCVVGRDEDDDADVVDVDALAARVPADTLADVSHSHVSSEGHVQHMVYEGHLSHLLGLDVVWVVRCDPAVLRGRLEARGYSEAKIRENLEAEALDIILQEALDATPRVVQRDGTRRSPDELLQAFVEIDSASLKSPDLEEVDWSHRLPL